MPACLRFFRPSHVDRSETREYGNPVSLVAHTVAVPAHAVGFLFPSGFAGSCPKVSLELVGKLVENTKIKLRSRLHIVVHLALVIGLLQLIHVHAKRKKRTCSEAASVVPCGKGPWLGTGTVVATNSLNDKHDSIQQ